MAITSQILLNAICKNKISSKTKIGNFWKLLDCGKIVFFKFMHYSCDRKVKIIYIDNIVKQI